MSDLVRVLSQIELCYLLQYIPSGFNLTQKNSLYPTTKRSIPHVKYGENNYSYQTLIHFWSVEHKVVTNVLYRLKVLDIPRANIDQIRDLLPPSIFYHCRKWNLKYLSLNTDNLSIYYVDMFKEKLLRISNHWSYVAFSQQHSTKIWIRGCWWELHGKRAAKPYTLPHFGDIYAGQVEFSQIQPVHK